MFFLVLILLIFLFNDFDTIGVALLRDPVGNNIRQYLYAQCIRLGSDNVPVDPNDHIHAINCVKALLLNKLQVCIQKYVCILFFV